MNHTIKNFTISAITLLLLITANIQLDAQAELNLKLNPTGFLMIEPVGNNSNIFLGIDSGFENTTGFSNVFLGDHVGINNLTGVRNTFVGDKTGQFLIEGNWNTFIGSEAGRTTSIGNQNTFVGEVSGSGANGNNNSYFGIGSGRNLQGNGNVAIGRNAGIYAMGDLNVLIGSEAGYDAIGNNKLYIENSSGDSTEALIYGEFDNDFLRLNADVNINGSYTFPSTFGLDGQFLGINENSQFGWTSISSVKDTDADTGILVEESADEDMLRFYADGEEVMTLKKNVNNMMVMDAKNVSIGTNAGMGSSESNDIFIGNLAGQNQSSGDNNTYMGYKAGNTSISASGNTLIGSNSGKMMDGDNNTFLGSFSGGGVADGNSNTYVGFSSGFDIEGNENIAIGNEAGYQATGDDNIFIGYQSGKESTGDDKLFIENSGANSSNALIYGEFDNDILRINGSLGVGIAPSTNIDLEIQANSGSAHNIVTRNEDGAGNFIVRADGNSGIRHHSADVDFSVRSKLGNTYNIITEDQSGNDNFIVRTNGNSGIREAGNVTDFTVKGRSASVYNFITKDESGNNNFVVMDDGRVGVGNIPDSDDLLHIENGDGQDVLSVTSSLNPVVDLYATIELQTPEEGATYPDSEPALKVNSKFFMNSSGQLSVGHNGTPQRDIHIKQSNSSYAGIRLEYQSDSDYWDVDIDSSNDYNFRYNGSLKGYIKDTDGVYVVSSDRRLKENIKTLTPTLSKIKKLRATQYRFKNDDSQTTSTGFIAQEVQEVFPEFVTEKEGMLRIGYDYFIPVAISGIQELAEENEMLKSELEDLRAEVEEIKALLKK